MPDKGLHVQQNENVDRGRLQVNVTSTLGLQPVVNARVGIAYTGESQRLLEELETDSSGGGCDAGCTAGRVFPGTGSAAAFFRIYGDRAGRRLPKCGSICD